MLRVVMFDLGRTLIDERNQPFPHVAEALSGIAQLVDARERPLRSCLVSDFKLAAPPITAAKLRPLLAEYLTILEGAGLRSAFEPVERRITLSSHAGVFKPERALFETALRRLGSRALLSECLLITEDGAHIQAVQAYGMLTLQFRSDTTPQSDFSDWSQAPLLVAHLVSPSSGLNLVPALGAYLAVHHPELMLDAVEREGASGLRVRCRLWQALEQASLGALSGLHVPLPVVGEVRLGARGELKELQVTPPTPEALAEAATFVVGLHKRGQIVVQPGVAPPHATHEIALDVRGRRKLVRRRFGAG